MEELLGIIKNSLPFISPPYGQYKVCVGMSGGVDSAVSAAVLKSLGFQVFGIFMKNWQESGGACSAQQDFFDVQQTCDLLDIPYYSVNFCSEYQKRVFHHFLDQYQKGFTPNPDILCNSEIKFDVFYNYAKKLGADLIATGHYCQTENKGQDYFLKKGFDKQKDQSYFLHAIDPQVLRYILFPIGGLEKHQVRQLAAHYQIPVKDKKDSTGICFIGEKDFQNFLSQYIKNSAGSFIDIEGNKIGTHHGACYYTPGQRKGLGLGGPGEPWYVADKNIDSNEVMVVRGHNHPALYCDEIQIKDIHWLKLPDSSKEIKCKIRYRQLDQDCQLVTSKDGTHYSVKFQMPQRGVALGQYAVFYQDDFCLGGGVINGKSKSFWQLGLKPHSSDLKESVDSL